MPLGHEISGVVAAVGGAVRNLKLGQRVAVRAPAGPEAEPTDLPITDW